jgi:hypothetical protein
MVGYTNSFGAGKTSLIARWRRVRDGQIRRQSNDCTEALTMSTGITSSRIWKIRWPAKLSFLLPLHYLVGLVHSLVQDWSGVVVQIKSSTTSRVLRFWLFWNSILVLESGGICLCFLQWLATLGLVLWRLDHVTMVGPRKLLFFLTCLSSTSPCVSRNSRYSLRTEQFTLALYIMCVSFKGPRWASTFKMSTYISSLDRFTLAPPLLLLRIACFGVSVEMEPVFKSGNKVVQQHIRSSCDKSCFTESHCHSVLQLFPAFLS